MLFLFFFFNFVFGFFEYIGVYRVGIVDVEIFILKLLVGKKFEGVVDVYIVLFRIFYLMVVEV